MTVPDPVAVAVEAALTPTVTEAAAEVAAWAQAMAADAPSGHDVLIAGPDGSKLRLRAVRVLAAHAYATGAPCDGESCEQGGAAHCHRCPEAESDALRERDRLREALTELLAIFPGAYYSGTTHQFMSRSQWIETAKLDTWRALAARAAAEQTPHSEGP